MDAAETLPRVEFVSEAASTGEADVALTGVMIAVVFPEAVGALTLTEVLEVMLLTRAVGAVSLPGVVGAMALSAVVALSGVVAESVEFVEETDFAAGAIIILCATGAQLDGSASVTF